jgi:hypothetical protein
LLFGGAGSGKRESEGEMRIPKRFKLFGQQIKVEFKEDLTSKNDCIGQTRYRTGHIILQTTNPHFTKVRQEQTFFHELIHWVFEVLKEDDLNNNEKLVEQMSQLVHQALTTAEY